MASIARESSTTNTRIGSWVWAMSCEYNIVSVSADFGGLFRVSSGLLRIDVHDHVGQVR